MRFGSGSYDVRRSEGLNPSLLQKPNRRSITCTVAFLDGAEKQFTLERNALGESLLDKVFSHLELVERDFFGLQFYCVLDTKDTQHKKWLDPRKSIRKQMLFPPYHLFFKVKFYVSDPAKLSEEYTRYHFFQQCRQDIHEGRLPCADGSLALLASYAVQSELGDYSADEHPEGYLHHYQFAPQQPIDFGRRVAELHQMHIGQTPADAEYNFLDHAKRLDLYGVDLYQAEDGKGLPIGVGVNSFGMIVFHDGLKINEFPWVQIMKLSFKKKNFYVQVRIAETVPQDTTLVFHILSAPACKQLWKSCIEHHTFFRLIAPPIPPIKKLFNLGSKFRYSGRTEFQTMEDVRQRGIERNFHRSGSKTGFVRATFSGTSTASSRTFTPSSPESSRIYSEEPTWSAGRLQTLKPSPKPSPRPSGHLKIRNQPSGLLDATIPESNIVHTSDSDCSAPTLRRRPKETTFGVEDEDCETISWSPNMQACTSTASVHHRPPSVSAVRKNHPNGNGYQSTGYTNGYSNGYHSPYNGYASNGGTVSRASNNIRNSPRLSAQQVAGGSPRSSVASYSSQTSALGGSPPRARRSPHSNKSNSPVGEDCLVTVRMRPDNQGRFGFNVKGGADQNHPVIVSRVASGSSADKAHPRLNEGDQVMFINSRDVSTMSHDQVVTYIRSARSIPHGGGELVLTIKPNVYRLGEEVDEPDAACVPEPARVEDSVPRSDKLKRSLLILQESLASGKIVSQFEQLYRKKPGLSMNDCIIPCNLLKNRYRDVCPYDATRVRLNSATSGDYINANFINMEIPGSGIVNRYIACQGPLAGTCADFWVMVWEQLCTTIVMLTTAVERGRVKCHQYWPRLSETVEHGRLIITCLKDRETSNCCYREFSVRDRISKEERRVTQMQYIAWPDHGVPDDPKHFITFVDEVRRARLGSVEPIVVHCSAGIGRTGVLILMETAGCLVEANEPVYPLDIVRTMRDQRAMLIQTPGQYTFVCDSILRAFNDGVIKPLAEYQKR